MDKNAFYRYEGSNERADVEALCKCQWLAYMGFQNRVCRMQGPFEKENHFFLKPKKGPKVKIELVETIANKKFVDLTKLPFAKMYGEHTFDDTPYGLKITTTMKVEGMLSFLWVKLVGKDIAASLPVEMEQQVQYASKL